MPKELFLWFNRHIVECPAALSTCDMVIGAGGVGNLECVEIYEVDKARWLPRC
jgi:hypothetical protein